MSDCRKRSCALACQCAPRPLPSYLGELYVSSAGAGAGAGDGASGVAEILHGYLALLVAKVIVHGTELESLYAVLPGAGPQDKARGVLDTLRDFNSVNEEWVKRVGEGEQHDETIAGIALAVEEMEQMLA